MAVVVCVWVRSALVVLEGAGDAAANAPDFRGADKEGQEAELGVHARDVAVDGHRLAVQQRHLPEHLHQVAPLRVGALQQGQRRREEPIVLVPTRTAGVGVGDAGAAHFKGGETMGNEGQRRKMAAYRRRNATAGWARNS